MKLLLIRLLVVCCTIVALSYATLFAFPVAPAWAPLLLAVGANGMIMTLMALGAMRRDSLPATLGWTFVALFLVCAGAFVVALVLPAHEGAGGPLFLGLPLRTAIVVYGVGVLPIGVLPFAYAFTFDSSTLAEADLSRVREAHARLRSSETSA